MMCFVLPVVISPAIAPSVVTLDFRETVERIGSGKQELLSTNVSAVVKKPRETGSRSWFLITAIYALQNSGIIGK